MKITIFNSLSLLCIGILLFQENIIFPKCRVWSLSEIYFSLIGEEGDVERAIRDFEIKKYNGRSVFASINIGDRDQHIRKPFISAINDNKFIVTNYPDFVKLVNEAAEQERKHRALAIQMHRAAKNMSYQESTQADLGRNLALRIILNDPHYQCKEINLWHAIVTAPRGQELLTGLQKKNPWTPPPSLMSSCSIL